MKLSTKVAELTQIIEPAVTACDVSLWGLEFLPQGRRSLLRIYIESLPEDKLQGKSVTIEDCVSVNHQVSGVLEVHDPISGEYLLEVSSPGLDRPFFSSSQLHDYVGETIHLRLIHPIGDGAEKRRKLTGKLLAIDENQLTIELEKSKQISVILENVDKANLVYQF